MRSRWFGISGFALALILLAPASNAQYMYLDSNGDGVHSAADVLHAVGPTVIDIWLDIGHNRDGSVATCKAVATEPLNMFAYVVDLTATSGTVTYSAYTNRTQEMGPVSSPRPPDGTNFSTGPFFTAGTAVLPPGKYLLGTLTVFAASGTPSIQIVPGGDFSVFGDRTAFGSQCDGTDFPNTIALGTDWFDVDGLAFEVGGTENQGPSLARLADMGVHSGENATQAVMGSDPEGQPLTFSKASGPGFMFVNTTSTGSGTASGEVRLAPFASDVGSSAADVSVTDGSASDHADFTIIVTQGANHPPYLPPIPKMTVSAGEISRLLLTAGDPDGGTLHFAKISGPLYVGLRELAGRPGGASAVVTLAPAICDVGTATATFSVTDGFASLERSAEISVVSPTVEAGAVIRLFSAGFMNGLAIGDLNNDGNLDVVAAEEDHPAISVLLGDGDGNLAPGVSYGVTGQNAAIAIADFNRDGAQDVAVTNPADGGIEVLLGRGDGSLLPGRSYQAAAGAIGIAAADLNRDGIPDLVVVNQETSAVSVFLGIGDGTFGPKRDSPAGFTPTAFTIGDFNMDGRLDVVAANPAPPTGGGVLTFLPGLGDGTFGDGTQTPFTGFTFALMSGDWNSDGLPDVALVNSRDGTVQTFANRGGGAFAPGNTVASVPDPGFLFAGVAADMNGDGNTDLVVSDVNSVRMVVIRGDGKGGFLAPVFQTNRFAQGLAVGDMDSDGRTDLVGTGALLVDVFLNTFPAPPTIEARAFASSGNHGPSTNGNFCVRIELGKGNSSNSRPIPLVDPSTVTMRSEGTGSVSEIHSIATKTVIAADTDNNGSVEAGVCFASQDVEALFDKITKRTRLTAQISGASMDSRSFCSTIPLTVGGKLAMAAPSFSPNPFNPVSRLHFSTMREGPAKALLFDINGRLVRRLLDSAHLPAGEHEYIFDGRSDRGSALSSGVYFYRVESTEGSSEGRIVMLK